MLFNRNAKFISWAVLLPALLLLLVTVGPALGQKGQTPSFLGQTTTFTYQGRLIDGGTPANGNYDLQFALWDGAAGGVQIGATQTVSNVSVSAGIFTVTLDFGANAFPGANRFLEIGVRLSGSPNAFTVLSPRQQITSTPYAVRSASASLADSATAATTATTATNATQLGGVVADQYVLTNDARLSDARLPTAGSSNYIQNTTNQQASSNFNISGNGAAGGSLSAGTVNATTQYNLGGFRILKADASNNTFLGLNSGASNTSGDANSFFGSAAGFANTTGESNSFFGSSAGQANTGGTGNSFFGTTTGFSNNTGNNNSFFGIGAGASNTSGAENAFFGLDAGRFNTTANGNAFFGGRAGTFNSTGDSNAFFGGSAGFNNTTGASNSFFGASAGQANAIGGSNSFFGSLAGQNTNNGNNSFFGYKAGTANTTGSVNAFFGDFSGASNTTASENSFFGSSAGSSNTTGAQNVFVGRGAGSQNTTGNLNTFVGFGAGSGVGGITNATAIGAHAEVTQSNSVVLGDNAATVGIGTTAPAFRLDVADRMRVKQGPGGTAGIWFFQSTPNANQAFVGMLDDTRVGFFGNSGGGWSLFTDTTTGVTTVSSLAAAGATQLCRNNVNAIATCSSSLRYKKDVARFAGGMDIVNRLRPISFTWKQGGMRDIGLGAEEVEQVEPLLTFRNDKGEIEGVKYNQLSAVFINAIKEQQAQIKQQQEENSQLKARLDRLERSIGRVQRSVRKQHTRKR